MGVVVYAVAWLLFAFVHSLLARREMQQKLETYTGCWYRLLYNALATLKIGLVFLAGSFLLSDSTFALLDNPVVLAVFYGVKIVGYVVLLVAFVFYDVGRFIGVTQVVSGERLSAVSNEPLQRNGLSRWVRHPLYTGAFLILWGGALSSFDLWTAIWGTLYFVIGTYFEERKLLEIYADEYRAYQREVPRYFPVLRLTTTAR